MSLCFFLVPDSRIDNKLFTARSNFAIRHSLPVVVPVRKSVGRDEELEKINRELQYDDSRKTVVLHGLGGMGMTQLALAYEQRHRDKYLAVFWINSKDVDSLKQGHVAAPKRIFSDHPSFVYPKSVAGRGNLEETMEVVKQWLSSARNDRWLIIYDNHDTPKLLEHDGAETFDIRPFLPETNQGAILITTRSSQLKWSPSVSVKRLLNIEHGLDILTQMLERN